MLIQMPPVRWYHLLSSWIFILSALYPVHKISTFPLNVLALSGCLQIIIHPYNEHVLKNIYILALHLAPFAWIPFDLSREVIGLSLITIAIYILFIYRIGEQPAHIYKVLLSERHTTFQEFVADRFGIL